MLLKDTRMLVRSLLVAVALLLATVPTLDSHSPRLASLACAGPRPAAEHVRPTSRVFDGNAKLGHDRAACVPWLGRGEASDPASWRGQAQRSRSDVDCDELEYQED